MEVKINPTHQRYPNYKDTGIKWLGKIPEHWGLISNKYVFKLKKTEVGDKSNNYTLLSLTLKGVIKRNMEKPEGKFPSEYNKYQVVNKGDFVFCLFDVEETPRTVGFSNYEGMITGAYTVMKTYPGYDDDFIYYFYLNLDNSKRLRPLYKGLRNTIPKDRFFSFKTFIPPKPEQTRIAQFLDRKCAQIDKAIAQKQRLIELLKERRQIIIQNAVTSGLDPNVKLKDSGVEWIGKIPEHWEVKRLKFASNLISDKISSKEINLKYIGLENIESWSGKFIQSNIEPEGLATYFQKGDVLFGKLRPYLAKVYLAEMEGIGTTEFLVFRPKQEMLSGYLRFIMRSFNFIQIINSMTYGAKMPRANSDFLNNIMIPIPPKNEQIGINEHINFHITRTAKTIDFQIKQIQKLKEYKFVLIDNAVTGKIKVNEKSAAYG